MDADKSAKAGNDMLVKSIDARCNFFKFGYQLGYIEATLDSRIEMHGKDDGGWLMARDAAELLSSLREVAEQTAGMERVAVEISDVLELAGARFAEGDILPLDLLRFLKKVARKWYGGMCGFSVSSHKLAFCVAFNLDIAGQHEVAGFLYEAVVGLENGAYRSCALMCRRALQEALVKKGAKVPGSLADQLAWGKDNGLLSAKELFVAGRVFGNEGGNEGEREAGGEVGRDELEDGDGFKTEMLLRTTIRLTGRVLRAEIEEGMLGAMSEFAQARVVNRHPSQ